MKLFLFFQPALAIAGATYKELVRDKLLYGILVVALLVTASSFFLSTISLGQDSRVLQNIGLASIHIFTAFICIFTTTTSLARDFERRVPYLLFPKPISRSQYVLGKYLGLILLLLTTLIVLGGLFTLGTLFVDAGLVGGNLLVLGFRFLEISLLIALALLFASFAAPLNASLYAIALLIIGHSLSPLREYAAKALPATLKFLIDIAYLLLPNLEKFDIQGAVLYRLPLNFGSIGLSIAYWAFYVVILLILTVSVMKNREV